MTVLGRDRKFTKKLLADPLFKALNPELKWKQSHKEFPIFSLAVYEC